MWYGFLIFCGVVGGTLLADTGYKDNSVEVTKAELKDDKTNCDSRNS